MGIREILKQTLLKGISEKRAKENLQQTDQPKFQCLPIMIDIIYLFKDNNDLYVKIQFLHRDVGST